MTDDEIGALRRASSRALTHDRTRSADAARGLAHADDADLVAFEARIARELGKASATYFPTGTMAQQIALRIWCDRARNANVAFHPLSHLELFEGKAYAMLHGLRALHVGTPTRSITVADVRAIRDPLGTLLLELPQREIGALLPRWNDLVLMCEAGRRLGARIHLDGTSLWQAAPFYGRTHAEIAGLFDSAYVAFDMGLDVEAGGMLAGDTEFVAEARVWQRRHGGYFPALPLLALAAERRFDRYLAKMPAYRDRARELAAAFARVDGIVPNIPHTNAFHVFLRGDRETLEGRARLRPRDRDLRLRTPVTDGRALHPEVGIRRRRRDDGAGFKRDRRGAPRGHESASLRSANVAGA